ncbi:glucuronyl esterase domain-containing protein [Allorhodopirellula heiligendammensis]|uniref:4-O-methyl-glucuronoyl methylesterase-like domain-containing protein n=1 Tax=Allorhodopirellula heiligendammensis TaxID=2714739 RepID=A0A5C6C072_9BACT|nr:acetylxylan esterase [Allorhodopirellula heiligendammensis]TWU17933.1 hypothetical protein Poly21_00850 [Allorhodopirellula heiligendammensis]
MRPTRPLFPHSHAATWITLSALLAAAAIASPPAAAQKFEPNYDEAKVPAYQLPDPLVMESGDPVTTAEQWPARRAEIIELFTQHVFGRMPEHRRVESKVVRRDANANDGQTVRTELSVIVKSPQLDPSNPGDIEKSIEIHVLVDVPHSRGAANGDAAKPAAVPAFLGLNFQGNHTVTSDPNVRITPSWVRDRRDDSTEGNRAVAGGRGVAASRWPSEMINQRGYALITAYYGDIDPDTDDGFQNGIHGLMPEFIASLPPEERPGSIAGWTYGISCILDAIEKTPNLGIDVSRVGVIGHSRLGKTALWAGAIDPRFALVISNDSGCGGAALSRRAVGETVGRINASFPHWFCDGFEHYNQNENALPVDSHELIALAAPRPIAVGSATDDKWADPRGEFLAARAASPVYELLGLPGLLDDEGQTPSEPPQPDHAYSSGAISYHLRAGGHDLAKEDWQCYLDFADRFLQQD